MTMENENQLEMLRDTLRSIRASGSELHQMRAALALAFLETAVSPLLDSKAKEVRKIINGKTD